MKKDTARVWQPCFGYDAEFFENVYRSQHGACAICHREIAREEAHRDHDHETGEFRALLCGPCNTGLGMFHDDIVTLAGAIAYLEDHGKQLPWNGTQKTVGKLPRPIVLRAIQVWEKRLPSVQDQVAANLRSGCSGDTPENS